MPNPDILTKREFWAGLIAFTCVVGCLVLLALGRDGTITYILTGILVSYVGIDIGILRRKNK